jgi:hypothetical protein
MEKYKTCNNSFLFSQNFELTFIFIKRKKHLSDTSTVGENIKFQFTITSSIKMIVKTIILKFYFSRIKAILYQNIW